MTNSGGTPSNSWGAGLANMAKAGIGGYLQGQVDQQTPHGQSILSGMFGGQPTQLASANGGPANSIFSGLFGGAQPTT